MRKIIFIFALIGLFAGQSLASKLWVGDFSIKAGETKSVPIYLTMDSEDLYVAFQFDMYLPDGIEVAKNSMNNLRFVLQSNRILIDEETFERSHSLASNYADGYYTVAVSSTTNAYIQGTEGVIINMYVKASQDVTVGKYEAELKNVMLSKINATSDDTAEEPFNISVNKDINLTLGQNGYSTYCGNSNFSVDGAEVYTASYSGTGSANLTLVPASSIIEAGAGIILKGEEGATATLHMTPNDATTLLTGNDLIGVNAETSSIEPNPYVLASNGTTSAFIKAGATYGTVSELMNKAYLSIPGSNNNSIAISLDNITDTPELYQGSIDSKISIGKYIGEDGRIVIDTNEAKYTVGGKKIK